MPAVSLNEAGRRELFDPDGLPLCPEDWEPMELSGLGSEKLFALKVAGDEFAPVYRDGDVLIAAPTAAPRPGDRIVVRLTNGEVVVGALRRRFPGALVLHPLGRVTAERRLEGGDVEGIARVLWARFSVPRPLRRARTRRPRAHA